MRLRRARLVVIVVVGFTALSIGVASAQQNASSTAVPKTTATPKPTIDPDDVVMDLPGLEPLPDPSTLKNQNAVREPRTPRSSRAGTTVPATQRTAARSLPASGRDTQKLSFGGFGLVAAGVVLLLAAWLVRRRRVVPVVVEDQIWDDGWDDIPLIGW